MKNHIEAAHFIWQVADEVLRGTYTEPEYGKVILPFVVIRRLDCVLEETKPAVLTELAKREGKVPNVNPFLRRAAGQTFYNTSKATLTTLLADDTHLADNLEIYLASFSPNAREIIDKFRLKDHIEKLERNDLLYLLLSKFVGIDLHPDTVSNIQMGYIFEQLIFRAWSNESAGDHYTPREFIRLMVSMLLAEDEDVLIRPGTIRTIYDPACGTGGMLSVAEEYLRELNPKANLEIFGQQLLEETWAICCADMMLKGHDPAHISQGDTLKTDKHKGRQFDYMISNPPFGEDWKKIRSDIEKERDQLGFDGRFGAGVPSVDDGALLFLQHMIFKMKPVEEGGSRVAIVFNQAPLVSGDAGQGESEIRRWIIEHDWLEAVVALPDQMFFNTDISTYFWIVTNRKADDRKGMVQLIDARSFFEPMPRSMGKKRKFIADDDLKRILEIYERFTDSAHSRIVSNTDLGYRKVWLVRPMKARYEVTSEALDSLEESWPELREGLRPFLGCSTHSWDEAQKWVDAAGASLKLFRAPMRRVVLATITIADEAGEPAKDYRGEMIVGSELTTTDRIPLSVGVDDFMQERVLPFVPDATITERKTRIGYEIPITRYFYTYQPPRELDEIDSDIEKIETEVLELLGRGHD